MKNLMVLAGLAGVVGLVACGDDKPPGYLAGGGSGTGVAGKTAKGGQSATAGGEGGAGGDATAGSAVHGGKGGVGGTAVGPMGGEGGEGGEPSGTPPEVTLLSPEAVTNPAGGKVLVSDNVDVVCKAVEGTGPDASPVDPLSVKVAVLDAAGAAVISEKDALLTAKAGEYAAAVPLTGVTSGKVVVRCRAASTTRAVGSDEVSVLADRGPKLTLTAPTADTNLALKQPVKFSFKAEPQPLTAGDDTQADVASVQLKINGVAVTASPVSGTPGAYEATVDLNSAAFTTKPNGPTSVALSATNKRAPNAATSTLTTNVNVDGAGPVITVTSPASAKVVGGIVTVAFTVVDAGSGINADSIVVNYDTKSKQFSNSADWTHDGDNFTFKFDSRDFSTSKFQVPILVTAEDKVGNSTTSTSTPLYLDNVGPQVDLDPKNVRVSAAGACTGAFDPLGDDSMNDKQQDGKDAQFLRAFVWEKTNDPKSGVPVYFAGVDPTSVRLFFRNPSDPKALLVNTLNSGTGTCNDIQTSVVGESVNLAALTQTGLPWNTGDAASDPKTTCNSFPGGTKPATLCNGVSHLWQVVGHNEFDLKEPAVYAYSPLAGSSCTGQPWDYSSLVDADGFVCFAARAVDKLGNVGISPPLRLCVDTDGHGGQPACATSSIEPPTCTDGCTPPARGGGMVISAGN